MKARGELVKDTLVSTVMSNLGLERFLQSQGITLIRAAVGDRYVVEQMRRESFNLGGEQSGHIVLSDSSTTGDGLMAALKVLGMLKESGNKASEALSLFVPLPQILKNVHFDPRANGGVQPLDDDAVKAAIKEAEGNLANDGRLLVRASGTEPVIRVMAEGDDAVKVESVVDGLCDVIKRVSL